jgi:HD-GYP domain-containing protein (c-di-GMP phosphodiesterase class II)
VSIGVALMRSEDGSAEHAFACADRALYAAKRRGRNRICCFSELDHHDLRAEQPECLYLAEALAAAGDLREALTAEHSRQVAALGTAIALELGLTDEEVLHVQLGGFLHDVGKMGIPDSILTKPARLTAQEWETMKTHPVVGEQLILSFPELALASRAVRHHHERWDGTGYPDRLAGEQIPLEARIIAAADAFNAMISDRPYQAARSESEAVAELRRCSGSHFDQRVVDALIAALESQRHTTARSPAEPRQCCAPVAIATANTASDPR